MDLHIEDFWKDASIVVCQLYSVFPRPHTLFLDDVVGPDMVDQYGLNSPRYLSCIACLSWLQEEGLIRFDSFINNEAVENAVLTRKTVARLVSIIHGKSLIEQLRFHVRDGNPAKYQPLIKGILLADAHYEMTDFH